LAGQRDRQTKQAVFVCPLDSINRNFCGAMHLLRSHPLEYAKVSDAMTGNHRISSLAVFLLIGLSAPQKLRAQQIKRGITPEDYFSFQFTSDPHLSPDGKVVAYVLTTMDEKKNRRESSVWLVPTDGSATPRRWTAE
jgi:hypothetical protein